MPPIAGALRQDVLNPICTDCPLSLNRSKIVWGAGNPLAEIGFLGEGPGREEDESGVAFVGLAGKLLRKTLKRLNLKITNVIILNVVKCRPPNNRNPSKVEIEACRKYLNAQLECLPNLKVIVVLGRVPWTAITKVEEPVSLHHGNLFIKNGITYLYTFHPSYLLRNRDKEIKKQFISDIIKGKRLVKTYGKIRPSPAEGHPSNDAEE